MEGDSRNNVDLDETAVGSQAFTIAATVLFSLATFVGDTVLALSALVGLGALAGSFWSQRLDAIVAVRVPLALAPAALLGLGLLWPSYTLFPHPPVFYFVGQAAVLAIATVVISWRPRLAPTSRFVLILALVGVTAVAGFQTVAATRGVGIDVAQLHVEAADALLSGNDPYGEAVSVPNGSPFAAPGSVIVGYPYPPLTAILYAVPIWLFGDPRWISFASWLAVLAIPGFVSLRRWSKTRVLVVILLASIPAWSLVLQAAWTEMLTLGLISIAVGMWVKWPRASAVALGFALATKQYFLVALPLVLLHPQLRGKRSGWAVAAAALTLVPSLVSNPANLWNAIVTYHANTPSRPDSVNLVGLLARMGISWSPPLAVAIGLPLLLAVWLARKSIDRADFLKANALVLGVFFMLSTQAFANYWFLVAVLSGLAVFYQLEANGKGHLSTEQ